jgi:signal transduction histidine kinase
VNVGGPLERVESLEEIKSYVQDLTAILALPLMWKGRDQQVILPGFIDVLFTLLRADVALATFSADEDIDAAVRAGRCKHRIAIDPWLRELTRSHDDLASSRTGADGRPVQFARMALRVRDTTGVVIVASRRHPFPTDIERFILRAALNQTAVALETAALVESLRRADEVASRQVRITEALNRVGAVVASELDRDMIVQTVTDAATQLTTAAFGAFFYNAVEPATGEALVLYTLSGAPKEAFANFPNPRPTALFGLTFRGEGIVRIADVRQDARHGRNPPYHGMPPGHLPVRSYLAVPVKARDGTVLGGLFFGHPDVNVFTEDHERLAEGIASWASVALENARLYDQAREANRAKDDFLAVLSHELRTPLNAIAGWTHMLREGQVSGALLTQALDVIHRNVTRESQLIEDLLDISRIVTGKMRLEVQAVDVAAVVNAAVDAIRPDIAAKNIRLHVEIAADTGTITGDPGRIEQIVWNLVTNATKFTPERGHISVTARRAAREIVVVVSDTGQGIAPDLLPHVFARFWQAPGGPTRRSGGLGIGLALVRAIAEGHGGTVTAESAGEGRGATFSVRLPITSAS